MAAKREILCIGFDPGSQKWKRTEWLDPTGIHDFNLVFLNPDGLTTGKALQSVLQLRGGAEVIYERSPELAAMQRRAAEFETLLLSGGDIVIFAKPPHIVQTGQGEEFSGWTMLPSAPIVTESEGTRIQVGDTGPLGRFLSKYEARVRYKATLQFPGGWGWRSLATTMTGLSVAGYQQGSRDGRIVILPWMDFKFTKRRPAKELAAAMDEIIKTRELRVVDPEAEQEFWDDLVNALSASDIDREAPPIWVSSYASALEVEAAAEAESQEAVVQAETLKLKKATDLLSQVRGLKSLMYGTGTELELAVQLALELLGGTALDVERDRADLLMDFGTWQAVIEVKGKAGSAGEDNAQQLEKWATDAPTAKPILFVNAYRELAPAQRTKEAFPDQMQKYSKKRDHALATTTQLYVAIDQVQQGKISSADFLAALQSTVGVLKNFEASELPQHE